MPHSGLKLEPEVLCRSGPWVEGFPVASVGRIPVHPFKEVSCENLSESKSVKRAQLDGLLISVGSFARVKAVTGAEKSAYKAEHFLVH